MRTHGLSRAVMVLLVLSLSSGCDKLPDKTANVVIATAGPRNRGEVGHVTRDEFRQLDWTLGSWQGTGPEGQTFFESYHPLNDTTIQMYVHAYSANGPLADSARIYLSGGRIYSESRAGRWVAGGVGNGSILFLAVPVRINFPPFRGTKRIRWSRAESVWRIETEDAGVKLEYTMRRLSQNPPLQ